MDEIAWLEKRNQDLLNPLKNFKTWLGFNSLLGGDEIYANRIRINELRGKSRECMKDMIDNFLKTPEALIAKELAQMSPQNAVYRPLVGSDLVTGEDLSWKQRLFEAGLVAISAYGLKAQISEFNRTSNAYAYLSEGTSGTSSIQSRLLPQGPQIDITLGLQRGPNREPLLVPFTNEVGGYHMGDWSKQGLRDPSLVPGQFPVGFGQAAEATTRTGGTIKFNLSELRPDIAARDIVSQPKKGSFTNYELQQIMKTQGLWENTEFYNQGKLLGPVELDKLGIQPRGKWSSQ